ncbi:hypothetical protein [Marinobacter nitratireducens]|nr:hypothetical protein [Marinobacter nitratireducens]
MDITDDLRLFSKLDDDLLTKFLNVAGREKSSPVDRAEVIREIEVALGDDGDVRGLFRVLNHLARGLATAKDFEQEFSEVDAVFAKLAGDDDEVAAGWAKLRTNKNFIDDFIFSRKEQELKDRFNRFKDVNATVDIRPVFDIKREEIKKCLHMVIVSFDADDDEFVIEMSEDDIDEVIEELQRAKKKLSITRELGLLK